MLNQWVLLRNNMLVGKCVKIEGDILHLEEASKYPLCENDIFKSLAAVKAGEAVPAFLYPPERMYSCSMLYKLAPSEFIRVIPEWEEVRKAF